MDKVRLAIVGCGTISQLNAPGYLMHDGCEVTALCDPLAERAEERAREWGIEPRIHTSYEDVLNDSNVDAVELLTPTFLHAEQIVAGLEAGKHVSCQKPVAVDVAEMGEIVAAAERADTYFRTTENFLYYPPIVKARELILDGAVGDVSMVRIRTLRALNGDGGDLADHGGGVHVASGPGAQRGRDVVRRRMAQGGDCYLVGRRSGAGVGAHYEDN